MKFAHRKDIEQLRGYALDDLPTRRHVVESILPAMSGEADYLGELHQDCIDKGAGDIWVEGGMVELQNDIEAAVMFTEYRLAQREVA